MTYATLTFALVGASEIQLTPAGPLFRSDDGSGRPADVDAWRIDRNIAERLKARHAARRNPIVIDYEHQTILAEKNGQPAPAAGWIKGSIEWREGQGLFATGIEWTKKAAAMIAAGEYRYVSPVFSYDKSGVVQSIRMAALTNDPGLDGMRAVALSARLARLDVSTKEESMTLKELLAALGLPEDKTEAEALTALAALKAKADGAEAAYAALKAKALDPKAADAAPDPAKYVPISVVTELQNSVAALKAAQDKGVVDALFREAREAGKQISPEYEAHLRTIPVAALKGVLDGLTAFAALNGMQSDTAKPGADGKPGASANDLAVMKALGLTAEQYAKGKE